MSDGWKKVPLVFQRRNETKYSGTGGLYLEDFWKHPAFNNTDFKQKINNKIINNINLSISYDLKQFLKLDLKDGYVIGIILAPKSEIYQAYPPIETKSLFGKKTTENPKLSSVLSNKDNILSCQMSVLTVSNFSEKELKPILNNFYKLPSDDIMTEYVLKVCDIYRMEIPSFSAPRPTSSRSQPPPTTPRSQPPPTTPRSQPPPTTPISKKPACEETLANYNITSKKDFLKWALKNHPDKGGDTAIFQEVSGCVTSTYGGSTRRRKSKNIKSRKHKKYHKK